jgi:AraC family transcriptional regulator of adaptative response/methylated-DNA-[protein]-cysteine methyltransferase
VYAVEEGQLSVDLHADLVQRVCRYIEDSPDCMPTLAEMGGHVGMSPYHLQRVFKKLTGVSPRDYADSCRVKRLKNRLRDGANVTEALYDAGYGSSSRLYEQSAAHLGMTPLKYRKGGEGMHIRYTITDCKLGRLAVAMTAEGICCVCIDDDDEVLEKRLFDEYPAAEIQRDDQVMAEWVEQFLAFLNGWQPHFNLPLDVRATTFQLRVWQSLLEIPYGETRSYREIAEAIGQPNAFRAVANACAANPVPLVVPCHRVIRSDGDIGGYGLGVERKRVLLEQEHEIARRQHEA